MEPYAATPMATMSRLYRLGSNRKKINPLYDMGHKIIFYAGRGSTTGIDWFDLTKK